ncbi:hypothetical protein [Chromobacterium piscinae]|uniref:hypothetical protein n=1 Tax=Chromobacterium piscinae TaxID=686831 RepID=UPI00320B5C2F
MKNALNTPLEIAQGLSNEGMQCNCDLDNWMPEPSTGHSPVCRIHKLAWAVHRDDLAEELQRDGKTKIIGLA